MSKFVTIEIDLPEDLHAALRKIADEKNMTVEELIVEILKEYCNKPYACRYTINVKGNECVCDEAMNKIQRFAEDLRNLYKEDLTIGVNVETIDADEV